MGKLQVFNIKFNNHVLRAGEMISGNVNVVLSQPMKADELRLKFRGEAYVHWTETRTTGTGENRRTETVTYSARENYYDYKVPLWRKSAQEEKIPAGTHVFPFSFQLRPNSPASFEGDHGHVRYWIKATIDKPWKFDHDVKAAFSVICHMDLNNIPRAKEPILQRCSDEVGCCTSCSSNPGKFEATVQADHRGYVPGEQVHAVTEIHNSSSEQIVGSVLLKMYIHFRATSKTRSSSKTLTETPYRSCEGSEFKTWDDYLSIPSIPPTNLGSCNIIGIEYYLKVKLRTEDFCSCGSVKMSDEIIIGTVPLNLPRFLPPPLPPPAPAPAPYPAPYPPAGWAEPPYAPQPSTSNPGPSYASASAPSAPFQRQMSTDVPPPSYEECMFMRQSSIRDEEDTEHTQGELTFAPRYAYYNLRTEPDPDVPPPAYDRTVPGPPDHPDMSRV